MQERRKYCIDYWPYLISGKTEAIFNFSLSSMIEITPAILNLYKETQYASESIWNTTE